MLRETKESIRTWTSLASSICAIIGLLLLIRVNWHAIVGGTK